MAIARAVYVVAVLFVAHFCGVTPDVGKREGEPCTRSTECMTGLECRGGVCSRLADAGRADGG